MYSLVKAIKFCGTSTSLKLDLVALQYFFFELTLECEVDQKIHFILQLVSIYLWKLGESKIDEETRKEHF